MHTIDFDRLSVSAGDRVLDLGCGEGRHAHGLALRAATDGAPTVDVVGVDLDPERLQAARAGLEEFEETGAQVPGDAGDDPVVEFYRGDATALPFADDAFDVAICAEVLEHLPAYGLALDELRRVLRPGGTLAVSVPRYGPERVCWALSDGYHEVEGGHVRIFRRGRLRGAVESRGFALVDSHHAHALHVPYWWLKCLWWDRDDDPAPLRTYDRFLEWVVLNDPPAVAALEDLLDPLLGKSLVLYFEADSATGAPT